MCVKLSRNINTEDTRPCQLYVMVLPMSAFELARPYQPHQPRSSAKYTKIRHVPFSSPSPVACDVDVLELCSMHAPGRRIRAESSHSCSCEWSIPLKSQNRDAPVYRTLLVWRARLFFPIVSCLYGLGVARLIAQSNVLDVVPA
ncbi:hypothetical protein L226DRAFT_299393 [Lentinus tigrinus ALCF2SS1-7]|uniref:Uncharacterized protein n=1 Tax=Lentinus tigrinus ALCF2SS1-6 TaxID=1328759 RepID=A0A5C2RPX5_9APHY|nr:hypothetical protein L227DRAFT_405293 [Lentinus tigrinus ALCF2SS1-6]RPD78655.1 hypothetical protein L226DRAFT_299393 [Lentinus tigrinus ALCF2SS1-7]